MLNIAEDYVLGIIEGRRRATTRAIKGQLGGKHTLVKTIQSASEFATQCASHKMFQYIFAGFPVFYRALENSIPLGDDGNGAIRTAQGKLISKGCNVDDPDYLILWRDETGALQAVLIEFKKVGCNPSASQRNRHEYILGAINIPTEVAHDPDEAYAIVEKYKIPNRGRGLF